MNDIFFNALQWSDAVFLLEAAGQTLLISAVSIVLGTALGTLFGWALHECGWIVGGSLSFVLDAFRSVPLVIQLVLFFNFFPIVGITLSPFVAGAIVLALYTSALVSNVVRGGIDAVEKDMRRAARSLGMSYWHDLIYIVMPVGMRTVFPAWVGVALSVVKDSSLVSVLGYIEVLRASQILITRTQEPFIILAIAGGLYFAVSFPVARLGGHLEKKWST